MGEWEIESNLESSSMRQASRGIRVHSGNFASVSESQLEILPEHLQISGSLQQPVFLTPPISTCCSSLRVVRQKLVVSGNLSQLTRCTKPVGAFRFETRRLAREKTTYDSGTSWPRW